jgi:hypothetical protein
LKESPQRDRPRHPRDRGLTKRIRTRAPSCAHVPPCRFESASTLIRVQSFGMNGQGRDLLIPVARALRVPPEDELSK